MFKRGPKMTKINPKMLKIRQIDPKISKKCVISYSKIPTLEAESPSNPFSSVQFSSGPQNVVQTTYIVSFDPFSLGGGADFAI